MGQYKGPGRPRKNLSERRLNPINFNVSDIELNLIDDRADELGISRSELIRTILIEALKKDK